jgi:hypothetical protein
MREPCGNEDCDRCYPQPRWKVSTETVRRIVHQRTIKAATQEEALAIYNEGTAWPSSYDEDTVEVLEEKPTVATVIEPDEFQRRYYWDQCWHTHTDSEGTE